MGQAKFSWTLGSNGKSAVFSPHSYLKMYLPHFTAYSSSLLLSDFIAAQVNYPMTKEDFMLYHGKSQHFKDEMLRLISSVFIVLPNHSLQESSTSRTTLKW
jgi:hypothetical protein